MAAEAGPGRFRKPYGSLCPAARRRRGACRRPQRKEGARRRQTAGRSGHCGAGDVPCAGRKAQAARRTIAVWAVPAGQAGTDAGAAAVPPPVCLGSCPDTEPPGRASAGSRSLPRRPAPPGSQSLPCRSDPPGNRGCSGPFLRCAAFFFTPVFALSEFCADLVRQPGREKGAVLHQPSVYQDKSPINGMKRRKCHERSVRSPGAGAGTGRSPPSGAPAGPGAVSGRTGLAGPARSGISGRRSLARPPHRRPRAGCPVRPAAI